jgi:anthranilate synthase/indole-3-glycerol phosphate synthase/phosphoribosylanthranilate isomerase
LISLFFYRLNKGADSVLLIVAVLGVNQLKDLISYCRRLGIEPLVEVHMPKEVQIAVDCGAKVIGVNNRNLHNFQ